MAHFLVALAFGFLIGLVASPADAKAARPNFLIIVADDLGFSDIGAFGGEIRTPNLDALAAEGVRFTDFHVAPTCSPTRAMLLTGVDHHRAGLGTMAELVAPNQKGKPGHEGYLRRDVATLAERLGEAGYATLFSGKWHLGLAPDQDPHARGFAQAFTLLQGAHNHFGHGLSEDPARGATYRENGRTVGALPPDFYSSDAFARKLVRQLADAPADRPFFAMLTFTAPHWPLQVPADRIAGYRGRYDGGFEALRAERLARQQALGLVPAGIAPHPLEGKLWSALPPDEQARQARLMEVYAAMVESLDANVGRVIAELKRQGRYDDTVILFLSDNGAEGLDFRSAGLAGIEALQANADNRTANLGAASSYDAYGPGWAQAATAPAWRYKAYQTEGGTRSPGLLKGAGVGQPGTVVRAVTHVTDVVPTFLALAGVAPQTRIDGRAVLAPEGRSWLPLLRGEAARVYGETDVLAGELFGSRKLRQGDWKLTDIGDGRWRLFHLASDPGETRDLATEQPERTAKLARLWDRWAQEVGVILPDQRLYTP
jgi:arylsulfatase